jgi:hypothetical protein
VRFLQAFRKSRETLRFLERTLSAIHKSTLEIIGSPCFVSRMLGVILKNTQIIGTLGIVGIVRLIKRIQERLRDHASLPSLMKGDMMQTGAL